MKRHLFGTFPLVMLLCLAAWLGGLMPGNAQVPGPQGPIMFNTNCSNAPNFGTAYLCFDTTANALYYWSNGAFTAASVPTTSNVFTEGAAPTGQAGKDVLAGVTATHSLQVSLNNGSALLIPTAASAFSAGVVPKGSGTNAALIASSVTDNGSVVSTTEALQALGGSVTAGTAGATQGNLVLSGSTAGTLTFAPAANTSSSYTLTFPATAGVQGSIPNFTNATGTMAFSATPTLGLAGTTAGALNLAGVTSGTAKLQVPAAASTPTITLPATNGTAGQVLASDAGAGTGYTWASPEFSVSAGSNIYGNTTSYPTNTVIASYKAANAGHFTQLNCVNNGLAGGSCTTAPTVNVFDGASNTGTAIACSTSAQTKGTQTTQAQTQTFAAGDIIGIYVSTQGGTCVAPLFTVTATAVEP